MHTNTRLDQSAALPPIPPDQYLRVQGLKTRYWTRGESGPPVILLHGGGGSVEFWLFNIGPLAERHRVYAIDMVGSGLSETAIADYSLSYQAEFVRAFMDTLGIGTASLVGNSIGGGVALQFALMFAQRLEKLVLVSSLGLGREIALGVRLATLPGLCRWLRPSRVLFQTILEMNLHHPALIPQAWMELRYRIFALPGRAKSLLPMVRTNFDLLGVRPRVFQPLVAQLPRIQAPALILWGKQDRILPVAHAEVAAQGLPQAQLHIFDPCGHHPHLEHPQRFNQLVLAFLAASTPP